MLAQAFRRENLVKVIFCTCDYHKPAFSCFSIPCWCLWRCDVRLLFFFCYPIYFYLPDACWRVFFPLLMQEFCRLASDIFCFQVRFSSYRTFMHSSRTHTTYNKPPFLRGKVGCIFLMRDTKKGYSCCTPIIWWFFLTKQNQLRRPASLTHTLAHTQSSYHWIWF